MPKKDKKNKNQKKVDINNSKSLKNQQKPNLNTNSIIRNETPAESTNCWDLNKNKLKQPNTKGTYTSQENKRLQSPQNKQSSAGSYKKKKLNNDQNQDTKTSPSQENDRLGSLGDSDIDKKSNNQQNPNTEGKYLSQITSSKKQGLTPVDGSIITPVDGSYTKGTSSSQENKRLQSPQNKQSSAGSQKEKNLNNEQKQTIKSPPSLANYGVNCYLNSSIQAISSCDLFIRDFRNLYENKKNKCNKLKVFNDLLQIMGNEFDGKSLPISKNGIFKNWNKPGQQDSFELLAHILNEVYKEIKNYRKIKNNNEWYNLDIPMRIKIKYILACKCGINESTPLQTDLALHVSINKETTNLKQLVEQFFNAEEIEEYECSDENCNFNSATRKAELIQPIPNTICIHLQRNYWGGSRMQKNNVKVKFDENLQINDEDFELKSIIVHFGTVESGHYVCYKKFHDNWFLTNDSTVSKCDLQSIMNQNPYILFYEKQNSVISRM